MKFLFKPVANMPLPVRKHPPNTFVSDKFCMVKDVIDFPTFWGVRVGK